MATTMLRELERSYRCGELEELKSAILPFLRDHRDKLVEFIRQFRREFGDYPLDFIIKYFMLNCNMPFNMKFFLEKQSMAIRRELGPGCRGLDKQEQVATWIRTKGRDFRTHTILRQIFCFERMKDQLMPVLKKDLHLDKI